MWSTEVYIQCGGSVGEGPVPDELIGHMLRAEEHRKQFSPLPVCDVHHSGFVWGRVQLILSPPAENTQVLSANVQYELIC